MRFELSNKYHEELSEAHWKFNRICMSVSVQEYRVKMRSEVGVWQLPNGGEYYRACLRFHLGDYVDPDEIHELGLREVSSPAQTRTFTTGNIAYVQ